MSQEFKSVLSSGLDRSNVDLSHRSVGTMDFGRLQPIMCKEVLPNDDITLKISSFTRAASLAVPLMAKLRQDIHFFFVPNRLLSDDFNLYINGQSETKPAYTFLTPYLQERFAEDNSLTGISAIERNDMRSIIGGLGFPVDFKSYSLSPSISLLPFRAYQRIWFDWYRDPQLISDTTEDTYCPTNNGLSNINSNLLFKQHFTPRYRSFKKDYLTTMLQSPNGELNGYKSVSGANVLIHDDAGGFNACVPADYNPNNSFTDNTSTAGFSIQFLRAANALQRWMEKNNVVGHKVIDRLRARFGVAPTDVRIDRAEFLGGTSNNFNIGDIVSSSQTNGVEVSSPFGTTSHYTSEGTMQGQLTGRMLSGGDGDTITYHSQEHGFIIAISSIMPDTSYYGGLERMWFRGVGTPNSDRFDYFTPEFANIGYQPVFYKEGVTPVDPSQYPEGSSMRQIAELVKDTFQYYHNNVIGWQPRYNEYRYADDKLFGDMCRPSLFGENKCYNLTRYIMDEIVNMADSTTADAIIEYFQSINFRSCDAFMRSVFDRIFAVTNPSYDHFNTEFNIDLKMTRSMPNYAMPDLSDGAEHRDTNVLPNAGTRL